MSDVAITMTNTVAESVCAKAGIYQYDGQQELRDVPIGVWYDTEHERWTWALDEATRWAVVRLAEMDTEWEDATGTRANLTLDGNDVARVLGLLDALTAPTPVQVALQDLANLLRGAVMER